MRPCFAFSNVTATDNSPAVLSVFEDIGLWGVQAKDFTAAIAAVVSDTISVEINSPGGDVFAALTMYNALRASGKKVKTKVMGVAASAASFLFLAGDQREMPGNTFLMVHSSSTYVGGTSADMREAADVLDKVDASMNAVYASRTGMTADAVTEIMAKDTWLTAAESKEMGFATDVTDEIKATASFDMDRADLPAHVRAVFMSAAKPIVAKETPPAEDPPAADPVPTVVEAPVAEQIEAKAKTAGLTAFVADIVLSSSSLADGEARIQHAREVVALCTVAQLPDAAAASIKAFLPIADVRTSLIDAKAKADQHTDNVQKQVQVDASGVTSGVNPQNIWKSHNAQSASKKGRK